MKKHIFLLAALLAVLCGLASPLEATTKQLAILMTAPTLAESPMECITARIGKYVLLTTNNGAMYHCTSAGWTTTAGPAGVVPAGSVTAGVTVEEAGSGGVHWTVFKLTNVSVTMTDATTNGIQGTLQLYDFPAGLIHILGASSDLTTLAGTGGLTDTAQIVCALGTVTLAVDATLTGTEADYFPSVAGTLTGGAGTCDGESTTALSVITDGTSSAKDAFLNFAAADAQATASDTLTVNGTVVISWIQLGDN